MLSSLSCLLTLLATLESFSFAAPAPEATSGPVLRKRVLVHELPARRSLKTRDGEADMNAIFKDFDRLSSKYAHHNEVYRQNIAKPAIRKRHADLLASATSTAEPYDLAQHRRQKRAAVASVSLTDDVEQGVDVSYYSQNLNIGTPAQVFSIDFDTGSADLWVLSNNATESSSSGNGSPFGSSSNPLGSGSSSEQHATFVPSDSSTNVLSSTSFDITYGTGSIDGLVSQDVVELNGLSVQKQVFGVATSVSNDFIDSPFDGLLGCGFSTISQTQGRTWPENLVQNNAMPSNLFSIQLERGSATVSNDYSSEQVLNDQSGMIIFGAVDSSTYTGSLVYAPVTIQAYWQVDCDGVAHNGNIISGTTFGAAIDSGTSLIYVPTSVAANIASSLGATAYSAGSSSSGYYTMSCDTIEQQNVAFSFAGTLFYINGADLSTGRVSSRSNQCLLSIVGADTTDPNRQPIAIVGDSFMKNVVAVFDYTNNGRVGMAAQKGSNSTSSPVGSNSNSSSSGSSSSASKLVFAPLLALVPAIFVLLC